jgi:hypothetical protein
VQMATSAGWVDPPDDGQHRGSTGWRAAVGGPLQVRAAWQRCPRGTLIVAPGDGGAPCGQQGVGGIELDARFTRLLRENVPHATVLQGDALAMIPAQRVTRGEGGTRPLAGRRRATAQFATQLSHLKGPPPGGLAVASAGALACCWSGLSVVCGMICS